MIQIVEVEIPAEEMAVVAIEQDRRGHCMKLYNICLISIFILFAGCSIKKKEQAKVSVNLLEQLKVLPDSDNDGISDELERRMRTNPLIADIPKISIGIVQDISIGAMFKPQDDSLAGDKFSLLRQEFSEIDNTKGGDIDSLKVLRRKVVKNQYNHLRNIKAEKTDVITNEDLRSNILSAWTDELYYPFMDSLPNIDPANDNESGKFIANLKIKITNATNVTEISDISLKSFFYDYELMVESEIYNHYLLKSSGSKERFRLSGGESYAPVTIYPLIANELKSNEVYSKLVDRSEIGIKFTDYSYTNLGIQLSYGEVLNKVFDGDSKIIYSDGIKTEVFFVSPALTVESALKQLGKIIMLNKDGDIYSINEIETTAKYPLDIDNLTIDDLKKGIWSVFGDADNLNDQMKSQGLYVVSYATVGDILTTSRKWASVTENPVIDSLKLDNIYEGDEILIELQDVKITTIAETISRNTTQPTMSGSGCNFIEDIDRGNECRVTPGCYDDISTPVLVENLIQIPSSEIKKWFTFEDGYGEKTTARVFKYENKIKIKFDSLKSHLKNSIKITFKNPAYLNSTARNGIVSGTCRAPSYSNQGFANQFKIIGSVKVFGINKY